MSFSDKVSSDGIVPESVRDLIDQICDQYEAQWQNGAPDLTRQLEKLDSQYHSELLKSLIPLDQEYRKRDGLPHDAEFYKATFQDYGKLIDDLLSRKSNGPYGDRGGESARRRTATESGKLFSQFKRRLDSAESKSIGPKLIHATLKPISMSERKAVWKQLLDYDISKRSSEGLDVQASDYSLLGPPFVDYAKRRLEASKQLDKTTPVYGGDSSKKDVDGSRNTKDGSPEFIGRYRILKALGKGSFGAVYKATDPELNREVAIKLPHDHIMTSASRKKMYLSEARSAAKLDHPNIVEIYDVGETTQDPFFLVMKYVSGCDLREKMGKQPMDARVASRYIIQVCQALSHAHKNGIFHRDIKPENILIDDKGKAYVVDFGLAFDEQSDTRSRTESAGTPLYMSPEQHNGESHRVDGRSDIFSVGVTFYELLTGRRPFKSPDETISCELIPLQQVNEEIPEILALICQKALQKQPSARYANANQMAVRLQRFLEKEPQKNSTISTSPDLGELVRVPGLSAFDVNDARFFQELLPGQRDIDGVPESLMFWKLRIESANPASKFKVGLIIGKSGCGKTSFVKAGLLPLLSSQVVKIYLEATPGNTEANLFNSIVRKVPEIADDARGKKLSELVKQLRYRENAGQRPVIIVIDQFEQWLNANSHNQDTDLAMALRQCDGTHVQGLLLVRDDFWLATHRFMSEELDVSINDRFNTNTFDLFSKKHARKVLIKFGRALELLPSTDATNLSIEQSEFVDKAVDMLADGEDVICIKLSLFVNMMKNREWTLESLEEIGGLHGVGINFLEQSFGNNSPVPNRVHLNAIKSVLESLLPDQSSEIKGKMKSHDELLVAAGYEDKPDEFQKVLGILDTDLRLITPTDPDVSDPVDELQFVDSSARYYQLTHDYLVQPLREWLTSKQKETRQGRAQLKLEDTTKLWIAKPESRRLPTLTEFVSIQSLTDRKSWSEPQKKMMSSAVTHYSIRAALVLMMLVAGIFVANQFQKSWEITKLVERKSNAIQNRKSRINELAKADILDVPFRLAQLEENRDQILQIQKDLERSREFDPKVLEFQWQAELRQRRDAATGRQAANLSFALLPDSKSVDRILTELETGKSDFARITIQEFKANNITLSDAQFGTTQDRLRNPPLGFAALRVATRTSFPDRLQIKAADIKIRNQNIANKLVQQGSADALAWAELLAELGDDMIEPLTEIYHDLFERYSTGESERAAEILAKFCRSSEGATEHFLALLFQTNKPEQFEHLFAEFSSIQDARDTLRKAIMSIEEQQAVAQNGGVLDESASLLPQFVANAAIALYLLGDKSHFWRLLSHSKFPESRSWIINRCVDFGVAPQEIFDALKNQTIVEVSQRVAAIQILPNALPSQFNSMKEVENHIIEIYKRSSDAGIHGAARYALLNWQKDSKEIDVYKIDKELAKQSGGDKGWFVNSIGTERVPITMISLSPKGRLEIGSTSADKESYSDEWIDQDQSTRSRHVRVLSNQFLISMTEITQRQFAPFMKYAIETKKLNFSNFETFKDKMAPSPEHPQFAVSWDVANLFCDWLTEQEFGTGFDKEYAYRLPTEAEWEYAARSNTDSSRFFGQSKQLMSFYAQSINHSGDYSFAKAGTRLPNDFGLFDMYGNAWEWTSSLWTIYSAETLEDKVDLSRRQRQFRVMRGGSFAHPYDHLRSAHRAQQQQHEGEALNGFRIARTVKKTE